MSIHEAQPIRGQYAIYRDCALCGTSLQEIRRNNSNDVIHTEVAGEIEGRVYCEGCLPDMQRTVEMPALLNQGELS